MTDLEMTKLCAEAMGLGVLPHSSAELDGEFYIWPAHPVWHTQTWRPLHDDAQAMALAKKFCSRLDFSSEDGGWVVSLAPPYQNPGNRTLPGHSFDLNRAIVECVANMRATK